MAGVGHTLVQLGTRRPAQETAIGSPGTGLAVVPPAPALAASAGERTARRDPSATKPASEPRDDHRSS